LRRKRTWQYVRFVVGIGIGGVALWAVSGHRGELAGASAELSHLDPAWLALAIVVEVLSLVAFAKMDQRLLRCGGVRAGTGRLTAISFAAGAIASSLPAGPVVSSAFGFRQFRRLGASEGLAAWTLVATFVFSALGLALLATVGIVVAERQGSALDLVGVTVGILGTALIGAAIVYQRRALFRLLGRAFVISHRITGFPRRPGEDVALSIAASLNEVTFRLRDLLDVLAWSVASWVLDCSCLVFAYLAVGAEIPWRGLLLAYGAGQLAANLPITPGGLGVVEGSLVIALVAYGGGQVSTVAAVLLYRIVSFWAFLPVGWLVWAGLTWSNRRADQIAALAAGDSPSPQLPILEGDRSSEVTQ
jgi:putative heme transporter